jgi:3-deoxy-D-manno-octulosonic-acid transferase
MSTALRKSLGFDLSMAAYSVLTRLASPFVKMKAIKRGRKEKGYLFAVNERLGYFDTSLNPTLAQFASGAIWIHAVSLGETKAAQVLIQSILDRYSRHPQNVASIDNQPRFVLTHSTATGRAAGEELIKAIGLKAERIVQVWYPWDTTGAVNRFLDKFSPKLGLLMETEVWPNMIVECSKRKIPTVLVNARLSRKSFERTRVFGFFAKNIYQRLSAVIAQNSSDTQNLVALGANVIGTFGNIKFDAAVDGALLNRGRIFGEHIAQSFGKPIVIFASSREGEEALLFHSLIANKELRQGVQWLIVPRHPQRFDEVTKMALQLGFGVSRRTPSALSVGVMDVFEKNQAIHEMLPSVWIGDTLGEMHFYYGMSKSALLGGSFEPLGGQNLIEAAACGCPLVMGPYVFNFAQAAKESIRSKAAVQMSDFMGACCEARSIALNSQQQRQMSEAALDFASKNRGAIAKTTQLLEHYL